jgi:hypothetical protein
MTEGKSMDVPEQPSREEQIRMAALQAAATFMANADCSPPQILERVAARMETYIKTGSFDHA